MGVTKEVWSKQPVILVHDRFRIGSDLNKSHWFRIGSSYVPCLQGRMYACGCAHPSFGMTLTLE